MKMLRHSALRYGLVGVSNTLVGFAVIWLMLRGFRFSDVAANIAGYAVGFTWSFALNRSWTFRHRGAVGAGLLRYALVCAFAYAANLLAVVALGRHVGQGSLIVQMCGMISYTVVAFVGSRLYAFPSSSVQAAD
jgi:putative flippase GtrA